MTDQSRSQALLELCSTARQNQEIISYDSWKEGQPDKDLLHAILVDLIDSHWEDPREYKPGGYAPIALGDRLHEERYIVVAKVGFGSSATVWMVYDEHSDSDNFQIIKLYKASKSSTAYHEIKIAGLLSGSSTTPRLLNSFVHHSQFGEHVSLVWEMMGPSLETISKSTIALDSQRKMFHDLASNLNTIHGLKVCVGDLKPGNLAFQRSSTANTEYIYGIVARYLTEDLSAQTKATVSLDGSPWEIVLCDSIVYTISELQDMLLPQLRFVDLGDCATQSHVADIDDNKRYGYTVSFSAPERILTDDSQPATDSIWKPTAASDCFALAVTMLMSVAKSIVLSSKPKHYFMVLDSFLGLASGSSKSASTLTSSQVEQAKSNIKGILALKREEGRHPWYSMSKTKRLAFLHFISHPDATKPDIVDGPERTLANVALDGPPPYLEDLEADAFADLCARLLVPDPAQRMPLTEVLCHGWFQQPRHDVANDGAVRFMRVYEHRPFISHNKEAELLVFLSQESIPDTTTSEGRPSGVD